MDSRYPDNLVKDGSYYQNGGYKRDSDMVDAERRLAELEEGLAAVIWLIAERDVRITRMAQVRGSFLAQAAQAQITDQIVGSLLNPNMPIPPGGG